MSSTQLKKEIYLRDVARRWKSELDTDKKVYILSPYITSKAEDVLANAKNCEIYTDFSIENFVFGSSSLSTLKNLINKGFEVYSVPNLHAKIILIADTFVSIGSQNLTNQGTKNKEATFTSTSLEVVKFVENEFKDNWISNRKEITLEMIEYLESEIKPLKKIYRDLKKGMGKVENFIAEQEKQHEIKHKEKIEYEKKLARLKAKLVEIEKTQLFIQGSVRNVESSQFWLGGFYSKVWTFVPDSQYGADLLNWRIGIKEKSIEKTHYYLSLIENTGKLSWARVMKTRITHFQQGIGWSNISINDESYEICFIAN